MTWLTCVCQDRGTRVLTRTIFCIGPSELSSVRNCVGVYGPFVPSSMISRLPTSPSAFSVGTVASTWTSCWPTLASMSMPGSICWRYGAASIMTESPMAVTPWPAGGGAVVGGTVELPGAPVVVGPVVVVGWRGGGILVTFDAEAIGGADPAPERPTVQRTMLSETSPPTIHSTGVSRRHDHWCRLTRWKSRPSAPWRTGCSMYRHDSAASPMEAAIWRTARS